MATSRGLVDGNKRMAFVAAAMLDALTGRHVRVGTEDELFDLMPMRPAGNLTRWAASSCSLRLSLTESSARVGGESLVELECGDCVVMQEQLLDVIT